MGLAYVDKQIKHKNALTWLPVLQDLFDITVDAEGKKLKDCKGRVARIQKSKRPKKFGSAGEEHFLERLMNFANLKEYKFSL